MTTTASIANEALAIVGIGCWYPDAPTPAHLWENVLARRRAFRRMPGSRLSLNDYYDEDRSTPDKTYGRRCAVIDGFEFDWARRRIPRRTFESTDVSHWLALEVALQTLDDAGYGRNSLPRDRTGVVVGNTLTGEQSRSRSLRVRWPFVERALRAGAKSQGLGDVITNGLVAATQARFKSVFPVTDEDTLAGSLSNTIAGRICNYLDLKGGGYTVDGACASSLLAVTTAANVLSNNDIDVALVGGVDVSLDPFELVGFAKVGALTATDMRVYDRVANGFLPGEGCGFVVLKRLHDARADGDYVYAVLRGWGVSSDGAGGITAPSVDGQALAIRRAYKRAGYSPGALAFVEGHGTGTPAGDPVEIDAIASAMEQYGVDQARTCGLTSFKSIVGHTKAAAGIGGLIKACIAVNRRVVPPTAGCVDPNAAFGRGRRVLYPLREGRLEAPDVILRAGVSAMGFGGINSHVTIESCDPPAARFQPSVPERCLLTSFQATELVVFAAENAERLQERAREVARQADGLSAAELTDFAHHLAGQVKPDQIARGAIVAEDPDGLAGCLDRIDGALSRGDLASSAVVALQESGSRAWVGYACRTPRIGFIFPGQGSQQLGMAGRIARRFEWAVRFVEQADAWLSEVGVEPIAPIMFRSLERAIDHDQEMEWRRALRRTEFAQPAICMASALWMMYLKRLGVSPGVVTGHSLGELSAMYASGALNPQELMKIAGTRGRIMSRCSSTGAMANLSCRPEDAEAIIAAVDGYCTVANLNAPQQTVVSGDLDAVEEVMQLAKNQNVSAMRLDVSGAFHSDHFRAASAALQDAEVIPEFSDPIGTPLITAMDGIERTKGVAVRDYLSRQVRERVDFVSVVQSLSGRCEILVEVGPGRGLSAMVARNTEAGGLPSFPVESRAGRDQDLNEALAALFVRGARIRFDALYQDRLTREFVPTSDRVFIENPCEQPLSPDVASENNALGDERSEHRLVERPAVAEAATGVSESGIVEKRTPRSAVLRAVERQTGFPAESLSLDLRLIDDLHLDSIKIVELVSDVADELGASSEFDAGRFADATLGELVAALESHGASGPQATPTAQEGEYGKTDRPPPLVSNFGFEWSEEPLCTDPAFALTGRVLVVAKRSDNPLALSLAQEFAKLGLQWVVNESHEPGQEPTRFDHVFVIDEDLAASDDERFRESIDLLLAGAALLSPARSAELQSFAMIRVRLREPLAEGLYDWSPHAFASTLHLERSQLRVRAIEFDRCALEVRRMAESVLAEVSAPLPFSSIVYDADSRRLVGKPRHQSRASYSARRTSVESGDVVLVSGGAKGITAQCAFALARKTGATMVLTGSTPAPDGGPTTPSTAEIAETLKRFSSAGLRCHYRQCDVTDRSQVEALVRGVREQFGSVDLVIHGAGLNRPRRLGQSELPEVLAEVSPKVLGALNLFAALQDAPPRMFIGMTSIIGLTGMPGNAWYAYANQSLDRSLARFGGAHESTEVLSIAYGLWDGVGMGSKLGSLERLAKQGIEAIPIEEGSARFVELVMRDPGTRQTIVTGRLAGIDTWQPDYPRRPGAHRFLERVVEWEPGRSLAVRTQLERSQDPYLDDHVYEGSHLFPAVFGLEAMAQAAASLSEMEAIPFPLRIEEIELSRPLVVPASRALEIELRALVDKPQTEPEGGIRVRTEIRCEQTAFKQVHFAACFVLGVHADRAAKHIQTGRVLPIEPKTELYGRVLFQGPRFQRIEEIHELDSRKCTFSTSQEVDTNATLLGDPYVRDALLQSLQLCVVPDQCLPVRIDRWDILEALPHQGRRTVTATIEGKRGDTYVGRVLCSAPDGSVVEVLEGYHARALITRPNWPNAERLASSKDVVAPPRPRTVAEGTGSTTEWDGGRFYRDVPGYGHQGQTAFFCRFPLSAQDSSSVSGSLNATNYFRWAGKLREWGGINTPGVYKGILEMLGSNDVMSATNECETLILKVPERNDCIEGRYWMEYVNRGDAGNIFEWWRIPFPGGTPEMIAWTRMRISAVKAIQHGVIVGTDWPEFLYGFLKDMGDDAPGPTPGPALTLDLGSTLYAKEEGPRPGPELCSQVFSTSQEDANVVGNIYFANYSVWQSRVTDRFFHSLGSRWFEGRGMSGELHRAKTSVSQLRDAMPFDHIGVTMYLDKLYERGADLSYSFHRVEDDGPTKIAAGRGLIAWAKIERGKAPDPLEWPEELRKAMLSRVDHPFQWRQQSA